MPKTKKLEESSDSDSGPEDRTPTPAAKKAKGEATTSKGKSSEEPSWELDKNRFVKVREFRGKVYIDIREFYDAGGELKPGKKGISLNASQWQKLKNVIPEVDAALKEF